MLVVDFCTYSYTVSFLVSKTVGTFPVPPLCNRFLKTVKTHVKVDTVLVPLYMEQYLPFSALILLAATVSAPSFWLRESLIQYINYVEFATILTPGWHWSP